MKYEDLKFKEISDNVSQSVFDLGEGYRIQILIYSDGLHDCNLYTPQGSILDNIEQEDSLGVEHFIKDSIELMSHIVFWEDAFSEDLLLINTD